MIGLFSTSPSFSESDIDGAVLYILQQRSGDSHTDWYENSAKLNITLVMVKENTDFLTHLDNTGEYTIYHLTVPKIENKDDYLSFLVEQDYITRREVRTFGGTVRYSYKLRPKGERKLEQMLSSKDKERIRTVLDEHIPKDAPTSNIIESILQNNPHL